ncbi:MAG TPA: dolichyl-phosphate-mannose--protein mannosyltransferase [Petrimonas sp.]|uniref:ArnT family glycosyltransferase n=1 Tax=Petrimonas sp. TaxID=2023866 RepID=UPI00096169E8|nr:glycosyltransferase family 39 protein [Petrimonas sp.]OJV34117.1 MAG: dolichyl-phosphate-mannose--protein mannosyltransferase [Bacteroidia bacterium 43-41]HHV85526.1 dolichyl-phosphate-mannose--protein mannosyltransferase [Petrimonas sp.]
MKNKYIYLIWFIALLPTMILRDFTPKNELRYLSIVDEALRNGNIFTFTNQSEIYADKPPLHFWLMMIGKIILGEHRMWYYSLLSIIPAFVVLITLSKWIRREDEKSGLIKNSGITTSLMLMTTGLFTGVTLVVRMDMLMNMFIVLSLYTFYKMFQGEGRKRDEWLFPVFVFLALFSKGPLGILIPFVSTTLFLLYRKRLSNFKKYWGWKSLLIILTGCIIWFAGVYLEGGNEYINDLLVHQTIGRGINSFHHKEPFYYYAISIWYSLAPWSLLTIGLIVAGLYKKKINSVSEKFFVTIILSTLALLSLISSKLEVYSLPVIPFIIGLSVLLIKKFNLQGRWIRLTIAIPAVALAFSLPVVFYLNVAKGMQYLGNWLIYAGAGICTLTGLFSFYLMYLKRDTYKSINTLALGLLLTVFIIGWSMPQLNSQLGWRNLCEKAGELSKERQIPDYWVYNISRAENMDVYLGKDIIKKSREDILKGPLKNRLLILQSKDIKKDPEIRSAVQNGEQYRIGRYRIVVFYNVNKPESCVK